MPSQRTFDFAERLGLTFIVQAAGLSELCILGLLLIVLYKTYSTIGSRSPGPVGLYFVSLLTGDAIQALGGLMNIKWVVDAQVTEGGFCTAQGAIKQVGDVAVALSSLAIAVDTFAVLFYRWRRPDSRLIPLGVIAAIWSFIIIAVAVGYTTHKHYYGNTDYWCWITEDFAGERIGLEYFWMWACAFINILLYIPLFFALRGNLVVSGWFNISFRSIKDSDKWSFHDLPASSTARKMLWYPIVYIVTVLPIAIVRWLRFSDSSIFVPFSATAFSAVLFSLSGFFNVILFTLTRPSLLPAQSKNVPIAVHVSRTVGAYQQYRPRTSASRPSSPIQMDLDIGSRKSDFLDMNTVKTATAVEADGKSYLSDIEKQLITDRAARHQF